MGSRNLIDWIQSGSEYYKVILNLESAIRQVLVDSVALVLGSGVGSLAVGQYYFNVTNSRLYIRCADDGNPNSKTVQLKTYYLVFGTWGTQAEMNNLELFQVFNCNIDYYLRYVKIFIMKKGNPTFTNMKLYIHSELNNSPARKVLATSENSWTNSSINSYQNAASEIWFRFNNFPLKKDVNYSLVLKADGTFTKDLHVSWLKLDSVYSDSLPDNISKIAKGSFRYVIIGRSA